MPTSFPGSNDSFSEPASPSSTPLDDDGGSGRIMVASHEDLGDAIMAMQGQATLLVHSHDGATSRHGSKLVQANTHQSPDTDASTSALHHTIGTGANQGAAGNHSHSVAVVWPVGAVFITEIAGNPASSPHDLPGTWTAIEGNFLVAAGSTFTAGSTGGGTSHTHSATFSTTGSHSHTSANVANGGTHTHNTNSTGSSTFGHSHSSSSSSGSSDSVAEDEGGSSYVTVNGSHDHSSGGANTSSHSHSVGDTSSDGTHAHTVAGTDTLGSHTHTSTINSAANINLPPHLAVYVWYRSA